MKKKAVRLFLGRPLEESDVHYQSVRPGVRAFIVALPLGILGFLMYLPFHYGVEGSSGVTSSMIAAVVLPMAIALNSLYSDARIRNQKAYGAIEMLVAANDAIVAIINTCDDKGRRPECLDAYTMLIRSIYCLAVKRPFEVIIPGKEEPSSHYEPIFQWLVVKLKGAKIEGMLLSGNGRLNRVLEARSAIKTLTTIPIPRSMYVTVGVLFLLSYAMIALLIANEASLLLGGGFGAVFTYAIGLSVLVAFNRSVPYGNGRAEIEMDERFRLLEEKKDAATAVVESGSKEE